MREHSEESGFLMDINENVVEIQAILRAAAGERPTLRDYFAGQALAGMLACSQTYVTTWAEAARLYYEIADAMLAEREKKGEDAALDALIVKAHLDPKDQIPVGIRANLEAVAKQRARGDDPSFEVDHAAGGNFDDAYSMGIEDGRILFARALVDLLAKAEQTGEVAP